MSEYVKDPNQGNSWKTISYGAKGKRTTKDDGAPVTADAMDEGADEASDGEEAPDTESQSGW